MSELVGRWEQVDDDLAAVVERDLGVDDRESIPALEPLLSEALAALQEPDIA